jgi:heptosyltransferase II
MIRRIAVFLPNWIGDVVMATPAIRAIRLAYPGVEMVGIGRPYVHGVLNGNPWFDEAISLEGNGVRSTLSDGLRLRRRRIDIAVLFPNSLRSALVARLAGCRRRIGFNRNGRALLLTDRLDHVRTSGGRWKPTPILRDYNRLARKTGAIAPSDRMELFTTPRDEALADAVWDKAGFDRESEVVCLNPGAAFGSSKLWPAEHFAALARRLARERSTKVLVLCGPKETDLAREIFRLAAISNVYTLADESVSIGLTKACVRRASLLISTDSGPRHFAAAFNRPVAALFGPTYIEWTQTFHPLEIQLQVRVPCGPCQQRTCATDHRCMRDLHPDAVYRAAVELLNRGSPLNPTEATHAA